MPWETIERPGYFGKKRDEIFKQYNEKYGENNWRIMWKWGWKGDIIIPFLEACFNYENSYYFDSFNRENLWLELISEGCDVCDNDKSNVNSGLDYLIQETSATHIQDIAIRRVVLRRGWKFKGNKLIKIRSHEEYFGEKLSPGKVPFHLPDLIINPHLEGWWNYNSIEDFYQSNKLLQVKTNSLFNFLVSEFFKENYFFQS